MLDGIKDDTSFSNLSDANLLSRWNLLQAMGTQLPKRPQASRELTPEENSDKSCNPEKDLAVPRGPQSPPASSIPVHYNGFHLYARRPGNQGIEVSEDPAPEHRLAETHTRQPRSEVRVLGDIPQRSHFWATVLLDNPAPPHRSEATNNDGDQSLEPLCDSQAIAAINPTHTLDRKASRTGASLNLESASQYGGENSEANTPSDSTDSSDDSQDNMYFNPRDAFQPYSPYPQPHAPANPIATFQHAPHGLELNPTYGFQCSSHASVSHAPINPTDHGRQASEANPPYASPYGSHGSQANAPIDLTRASPYGRQTPEAVAPNHPTGAFPYGTPAGEPIDPTHAFPYGRQGSEANMPVSRAYPLPYSRQGLEANASMNPAYPLPYGRQGLEANATINPAYPLPYGRQGLEANATMNPAYLFSQGRQVSGANPSVYPPPIPPVHNPEQMDHQLFWIPRMCIKCDKPWHGFGPCLDESADQNEERIPAKAAETRPEASSRSIRCGFCGEPGHTRTRCPKDPARKRARGQKVDKCENCGRYGHKTERCGNRYLEFWDRAAARARRENALAAATQKPTTQSAPEPKDGGGSVDEGKRDM